MTKSKKIKKLSNQKRRGNKNNNKKLQTQDTTIL